MIANPPALTPTAAVERLGAAAAAPLIEATDLRKRFGQTEALRGMTSRWQPARSSRSWARAARASRRCSIAWPG